MIKVSYIIVFFLISLGLTHHPLFECMPDLSFSHVKADDDDCIKEKCLVCKQFVGVMKMRTHLEACKGAKCIKKMRWKKSMYCACFQVQSILVGSEDCFKDKCEYLFSVTPFPYNCSLIEACSTNQDIEKLF